jgi:hypothetical protein
MSFINTANSDKDYSEKRIEAEDSLDRISGSKSQAESKEKQIKVTVR